MTDTPNMDVYRAHVRELACPLCGAEENANCHKPSFDAFRSIEVNYVHDERSAAHFQARLGEVMKRMDELQSATADIVPDVEATP